MHCEETVWWVRTVGGGGLALDPEPQDDGTITVQRLHGEEVAREFERVRDRACARYRAHTVSCRQKGLGI